MRDGVRWSVIGAGVVMAVGSLLPWAQAGIFSVAGTDGDGVLTLGAGVIIAIIGAINKPTKVSAAAVLLLAALAGLIVFNVFGNLDAESVGSGLIVTGLAAAVAFFGGFGVWTDAKNVVRTSVSTPEADSD